MPTYSYPLAQAAALGAMTLFLTASVAHADDLKNCRTAQILVKQAGKDTSAESGSLQKYSKAIELCPTLREAHYNLGVALFQQGKFDEAKSALEQARALGDDAAVNAALGAVSAKLGNKKESIEHYRDAQEKSPADVVVLEGLGAVLQNSGDSAGAEKALDEADKQPGQLGAKQLYNRGIVYRDAGKTDMAIAAFRSALAADAICYECLYELGKLQSISSQFAEAEKNLKAAVDMHPGAKDPLVELAELYRRQNKGELAEAVLQRMATENPKDADAQLRLGNYYLEQKKYDKAAGSLKQSADLDPKNAQALNSLGRAQIELKDYQGAETALKKAATLDERDGISHNNLGVLYQRSGKIEQAQKEYAIAKEKDPKLKSADENLATLEKAQKGQSGDPEKETAKE